MAWEYGKKIADAWGKGYAIGTAIDKATGSSDWWAETAARRYPAPTWMKNAYDNYSHPAEAPYHTWPYSRQSSQWIENR